MYNTSITYFTQYFFILFLCTCVISWVILAHNIKLHWNQ